MSQALHYQTDVFLFATALSKLTSLSVHKISHTCGVAQDVVRRVLQGKPCKKETINKVYEVQSNSFEKEFHKSLPKKIFVFDRSSKRGVERPVDFVGASKRKGGDVEELLNWLETNDVLGPKEKEIIQNKVMLIEIHDDLSNVVRNLNF